MIYVKESSKNSLTKDQQALEKKGFKILDIVIVHDGYLNGVKFFIKYVQDPQDQEKGKNYER